jgi:hypothetical protein
MANRGNNRGYVLNSRGSDSMKIRWLLNLDSTLSNRLHAFPADEKEYGDWSLCGRGGGSKKVEGVAPKCAKCLEMLLKIPMPTLEKNRAKDKSCKNEKQGATDVNGGRGGSPWEESQKAQVPPFYSLAIL